MTQESLELKLEISKATKIRETDYPRETLLWSSYRLGNEDVTIVWPDVECLCCEELAVLRSAKRLDLRGKKAIFVGGYHGDKKEATRQIIGSDGHQTYALKDELLDESYKSRHEQARTKMDEIVTSIQTRKEEQLQTATREMKGSIRTICEDLESAKTIGKSLLAQTYDWRGDELQEFRTYIDGLGHRTRGAIENYEKILHHSNASPQLLEDIRRVFADERRAHDPAWLSVALEEITGADEVYVTK